MKISTDILCLCIVTYIKAHNALSKPGVHNLWPNGSFLATCSLARDGEVHQCCDHSVSNICLSFNIKILATSKTSSCVYISKYSFAYFSVYFGKMSWNFPLIYFNTSILADIAMHSILVFPKSIFPCTSAPFIYQANHLHKSNKSETATRLHFKHREKSLVQVVHLAMVTS